MTFYGREATSGVRVVELVTFTRGQGSTARVWRYCTGDADVTVSGLVYRASTLTRGPIQRNQTSARTNVRVTLATETPFVREWIDTDVLDAPGVAAVTILRAHIADAGTIDTTGGEPTAAIFLGTVTGLSIEQDTTTVECAALGAALETAVPRIPILRSCAWSLYGTQCGEDPVDSAYTATIDDVGSVVGTTLANTPTVTLTMDGTLPTVLLDGDTVDDLTYFDTGVLLWIDGTRTVRVHIASADLTAWPEVTLNLFQPLPEASVGDEVTLWAGCTKTVEICHARFANVNRFGGFPRMPDKNPLIQGLK